MPHVAISANSAWYVLNFRSAIISALIQRGASVTVVAGADGSAVQLRERGCSFVGVPFDAKGGNPFREIALLLSLQREYSRLRPDVILNFTIKPVIYGTLVARTLGIPVINTITGLGTAFINETWRTRLVEILYRCSLPGPRPVVFQNHEDLALFKDRKLITDNPCTVVAGSGIDLDTFRPAPFPAAECITFLMVARLIGDKGIVEFVDAARLVRKSYPAARFQLLGPLGVANRTAVAERQLAGWIAESLVEYLGETTDVRTFLENAHCVVLPSYREGMPRVLLEAAAIGRPLIATDVVGCRDVVEDGINGYLCRARDAADVANKMMRFMNLSAEERTSMGKAARATAEARFDVRRVVAQYLALIDLQTFPEASRTHSAAKSWGGGT